MTIEWNYIRPIWQHSKYNLITFSSVLSQSWEIKLNALLLWTWCTAVLFLNCEIYGPWGKGWGFLFGWGGGVWWQMWVTWLPDNASHSGNLLPPYLRKSTFTSCALHACRKKYMHVVCIIYKTECFTFLHDGKGGMKIYSPEKNHKGIARKWE